MSDRTVIENRAVATVDESGARTADEREIAREIAGASERPIKKSRKLGAES